MDELRVSETYDRSESEKIVQLSDLYPHLTLPENRRTVTKAAIECGHDAFDVVALLRLAQDLDAVVGDWHMYDPLYSLAIRLGRFSFLTDGTPTDKDRNFRCYIPLPGALGVDDIWRLRDDPFVAALRDGDVARVIRAFRELETPESWRDFRKQVQERVGKVVFNPYNAHTREHGDSVLTEAVAMSVGTTEMRPARSQRRRQSRERVLFLAAEPTDECRLRLGQEYREISQAVWRASKATIELSQAFAIRPADLSWAILHWEPTIIHFSGHGTPNGTLCLEDELGQSHGVEPEALSDLFRHFTTHLKVVVLNACFSARQASTIAQWVSFVIGMRNEISDEAATSYSIGLYQAIGAGRNVQDAHALGCAQIRLRGLAGHSTPELIRGGGTPSS